MKEGVKATTHTSVHTHGEAQTEWERKAPSRYPALLGLISWAKVVCINGGSETLFFASF